jgi:trigger factor
MTDTSDLQYSANIDEDGNDLEITAEIPTETLKKFREPAIEELQQEVSIDGFRDGNIPEDRLEQEVGEMAILQEMAQLAIQEIYPKIIADNDLEAIGRPDIKLTKLSPDEPIEFTATTTTMPEVELPDNYKEIAREAAEEASETENEESDNEVTDEDVDEAIDNIRRQMAQAQAREQADDGTDPSELEITEDDMPELTDQFVQQISEADTVEAFRADVRDNLANQQDRKEEEAKRGQIIEAVVDASSVELPELVVEGELDKMMAQFESDIQRSGMEIDEYFEQADTDRDDMREKWRPDAQRRAKTQLVLNKIAVEEEIEVDDEEVAVEVDELMENYEDVSRARARTFVRSRLINEKTINYLESLAEEE